MLGIFNLEIKQSFSKFVPELSWDPHFNHNKLNVVAFKTKETAYILKSSLIYKNGRNVLSATDRADKILPILPSLLHCLTESAKGCPENIIIINQKSKLNLYLSSIVIRDYDNLSSRFLTIKKYILNYI